jgi:alpha-L-rhamnosidase
VYSGETGLMDAAGWGDAAVIIPWTMYLMTGNTPILHSQYASMKLWCDYIIKKSAKRGNKDIPREIEQYLWNTGYHLGEWMIPSVVTGGYGNNDNLTKIMMNTAKYTAPIFGWYSLCLMAKTAAILGFDADAVYYAGVADKIKDAFARGIITKDGDMPFPFQGAYVLPIYFDFVPEEFKDRFAEKLVSLIRENGNRLDTGFLATPFLLDALCRIGRLDVAYELLYQENGPSWLDQLNHGATTIWESWYCYDENGDPLKMSMNHYSFGCICDWMFRYIAGIEPVEPGFKHIKIHPRPDVSLGFARRTFFSEYGEIVCGWERKDGVFLLKVTIPCNTTATVVMPDGATHEVGSGSYEFESLL